jgi:hypothetical protein
MSLTVFSARSIANDLESAVGEEAFYFYMREIIEKKLFEKYVDDVNGEVRRFVDLIDFMTHKEGLDIKDLALFEKCLGVVASSSRFVADSAQWLLGEMKLTQRKGKHGDTGDQPRDPETGRMRPKPGGYNIKSGAKGTSRA